MLYSARLQYSNGTPATLTAASAQFAVTWKSAGNALSEPSAFRILSASVRLHELDFAATTFCQIAAAAPNNASIAAKPISPRRTGRTGSSAPSRQASAITR